MATFPIQDKTEQLIVETHYYAWLKAKQPTVIHNMNTKLEYLSTLGFVKGMDKLTSEDLYILKAIEEVYFRDNIKPLLKH